MNRANLARERNKAIAYLYVIGLFTSFAAAFFAFAFFGYEQEWLTQKQAIGFSGIALVTAITVAISFVFGLDNYMQYREPKPNPLPIEEPDNASDKLLFDASAPAARGRIEMIDDNSMTIMLGKHDLEQREWLRLVTTLKDGGYSWNRKLLQKTMIWEGLTVTQASGKNRYNEITDDFERIGTITTKRDKNGKVKKASVTRKGREALCEMAGLSVVL